MDIAQLVKRHGAAETERNRYRGLFDDCYRLALPGRAQFNGTAGDDQSTEIYDETGVVGLNEFASRFYAGLTPNYTRFARQVAGKEVPDRDRKAVQRDLDEIDDYLFERVWESNFAAEGYEAFLDMGVSTGVMVTESGEDFSLHHNAIPLTQLALEPGPDDSVSGMFRTRQVRAEHLPWLYAQGEFSLELERLIVNEPDRPIKLIDYSYRDWTRRGQQVYRHAAAIPELKAMLVDRDLGEGPGACPFAALRMGKASGEVWGRGPLMNVLAAVRTTNFLIELTLQNAAMSLIGMYQADDDAVINADTIQFAPGAVIPRRAGSRGLERIETGGGDFQTGQILLDSQRLNIRKGLYNDMLADPNRTPATALEISTRMSDLADRTASSFGRLSHEFLTRYVRRATFILEARGEIEMPRVKNPNRAIRVAPSSPLATAQAGRDVNTLMQYHQISAGIFGPQMAAAQYDLEELAPWLRERLAQPESLFRDVGEVYDQISQAAQAMMQPPAARAA